MKITETWLAEKHKQFWDKLIFLLYLSPYFGKLGWRFNSLLVENPPQSGLKTEQIGNLKDFIPEASEEEICRYLITSIFRVAPNYNRTRVSTPTYEYNEYERAELEKEGWERAPKYPAYYVWLAPADYQPLKAEQIAEEDIQKFKQKISVITGSDAEEVLEDYKQAFTNYSQRLERVREKVSDWIELISSFKG